MHERLPIHAFAERAVAWVRGNSPLEAASCHYCGKAIEPLRGVRPSSRRAYCDDECSVSAFENEH